MSGEELCVGDQVTLSWYEPGEPYRPRGAIVEPACEDLARLDGNRGDWLLVHWRTPNHRRWERRADVHRDLTEREPRPRTEIDAEGAVRQLDQGPTGES